jgi:hypothetical protein
MHSIAEVALRNLDISQGNCTPDCVSKVPGHM